MTSRGLGESWALLSFKARMNIFVVDTDPQVAAQSLCDKHVVKMPLESAQLLSTALDVLGSKGPYRITHRNHPCSVWTRASRSNFLWLRTHGLELCAEYSRRYNGRVHKCEALIQSMSGEDVVFPQENLTLHPKCMPEKYQTADVVSSYRNFYIGDKAHFATWKTQAPKWFKMEVPSEELEA